ncbi:MAG: WecB/TagA/CpsF family glycosyltransferase [Patescibacteria group bacterium]|nr:WecB/TagA/CpsF family glycosyltransferase [Patescibacteria group bacterium]
MLVKNFLLGTGITNASKEQILEYLVKGLKQPSQNYYIVTPNPEILVYANKHKEFQKILNNARLALPDGIGVKWAGKLLGRKFKQKITGVDFMKNVCEKIAEKPITVGLMGGRDGVAERTAECLRKKYPGLRIGFVGEEWDTGRSSHYSDDARKAFSKPNNITRSLNESRLQKESNRKVGAVSTFSSSENGQSTGIDILFVAYGFPKQEIWMSENIDKLPVKVMMGVGGAFDYISGKVPRAPKWVQKIGLEWFYRLIRQPWRLKRQIALLEFVYLVLKERLKTYNKVSAS